MSAQFTSNLDEFRRRHERARDAALVACAVLLVGAVKEALTGGYTSGEYVTGRVRSSVTKSEPYTGEDGIRSIRVGTNVEYAVHWELGFVPARGVFSPGMGWKTQGPIQMRRVEKWRPTAVEKADAMREKFSAIYRAMMQEAA